MNNTNNNKPATYSHSVIVGDETFAVYSATPRNGETVHQPAEVVGIPPRLQSYRQIPAHVPGDFRIPAPKLSHREIVAVKTLALFK